MELQIIWTLGKKYNRTIAHSKTILVDGNRHTSRRRHCSRAHERSRRSMLLHGVHQREVVLLEQASCHRLHEIASGLPTSGSDSLQVRHSSLTRLRRDRKTRNSLQRVAPSRQLISPSAQAIALPPKIQALLLELELATIGFLQLFPGHSRSSRQALERATHG